MVKFILALGLGIFILFGYGLFVRHHLYELERQYPPLDVKNIPAEVRAQIQAFRKQAK